MMTAKDWADAVITLDADLQDDYKTCIPQMVDDFQAGNDIVYGVKVSRTADPLLKRMSAQAFYRLQEKMGVNSKKHCTRQKQKFETSKAACYKRIA